MSRTKCMVGGCVLVMLALTGCSSDDVEELIGIDPEGEAAEAAVENALNNVIDPLTTAVDLITDLVLPSSAAVSTSTSGVAALACPNTDDWCGSGSASCTVNGPALEYTFTTCSLTDGTNTITANGGVNVTLPASMTLVNLVVNDGVGVSGSLTFTGECDTTWNINTTDGTVVTGTIVQCDSEEYPQSTSLLVITAQVSGVGVVQMTFTFDGTQTAAVSVTVEGNAYATCSVNIDTYDATCSGV